MKAAARFLGNQGLLFKRRGSRKALNQSRHKDLEKKDGSRRKGSREGNPRTYKIFPSSPSKLPPAGKLSRGELNFSGKADKRTSELIALLGAIFRPWEGENLIARENDMVKEEKERLLRGSDRTLCIVLVHWVLEEEIISRKRGGNRIGDFRQFFLLKGEDIRE